MILNPLLCMWKRTDTKVVVPDTIQSITRYLFLESVITALSWICFRIYSGRIILPQSLLSTFIRLGYNVIWYDGSERYVFDCLQP